MAPDRPRWLRYLAPPLAVFAAMLVRLYSWPHLFADATFMPMFVAVLFCAWLGGLGPGLVAMALGAAVVALGLFPPIGSLAVSDPRQQLQMILYVVFSLAIVVACDSLHRERRRAQSLRVDIGELEQAQAQLRALAAHLSEADRRKDEFLATLAHELRNPLAPMRNSLEVLRLAQDPAAAQAARATIDRQLTHLVRLVDDLLDVSRITRDKLPLHLQDITLDGLVRPVVDAARPLLEGQGLTLELDLPATPVHLHADPVRLAQVLGNLLHNAGKFTPAGGHVRVEAGVHGSVVNLCVSDDGVGVAPELRDRVFEMFHQGETSLDRPHGGLGIGLGLARRLVAMHGGEIVLDSDGAGRGTRVRVSLPMAPAPAAVGAAASGAGPVPVNAPAPDTPAAPLRPRRVLVADDNTDAADSMAMIIKLMGHQPLVAHDGLEAVALAQGQQPDLVLLDIGMPGLNGLEACRRMRAMPGGDRMQIVAVTGWGQAHDRERSREAGFDEHLVKPLGTDQLRRLLGS